MTIRPTATKKCTRCGEEKPDTQTFFGVKMVLANRGDLIEHYTVGGSAMKRVTLSVCKACAKVKRDAYWAKKRQEADAYEQFKQEQVMELSRQKTLRDRVEAEKAELKRIYEAEKAGTKQVQETLQTIDSAEPAVETNPDGTTTAHVPHSGPYKL